MGLMRAAAVSLIFSCFTFVNPVISADYRGVRQAQFGCSGTITPESDCTAVTEAGSCGATPQTPCFLQIKSDSDIANTGKCNALHLGTTGYSGTMNGLTHTNCKDGKCSPYFQWGYARYVKKGGSKEFEADNLLKRLCPHRCEHSDGKPDRCVWKADHCKADKAKATCDTDAKTTVVQLFSVDHAIVNMTNKADCSKATCSGTFPNPRRETGSKKGPCTIDSADAGYTAAERTSMQNHICQTYCHQLMFDTVGTKRTVDSQQLGKCGELKNAAGEPDAAEIEKCIRATISHYGCALGSSTGGASIYKAGAAVLLSLLALWC
eukprot:GHVU01141475.1.p1 GENE.GHVU01141475.1~~GHVU01141475.1.p1  ORF type:complete len:321 (-),score=24.62 GHVU01141475.1:49-1011(-)